MAEALLGLPPRRAGNHEVMSKTLSSTPVPQAPSGPQHAPQKKRGSGPNPFVVAAAAFGVGTLLAKAIDWRGHAHPRR